MPFFDAFNFYDLQKVVFTGEGIYTYIYGKYIYFYVAPRAIFNDRNVLIKYDIKHILNI